LNGSNDSLPARHAVFAYGSNLDLPDLERWLKTCGMGHVCPAAVEVAVLPDWELVWDYRSDARRGGAANVKPAPGGQVWGAVLTVDDALLQALDQKEGHPGRYRRRLASAEAVSAPGVCVDAWVYVVTPPFLSREPVWPTRAYLDVVVRGARTLGLPAAYVAGLSETQTCD